VVEREEDERGGEEGGAIGQVGEDERLHQNVLSQSPFLYTTYITYKHTCYYNNKARRRTKEERRILDLAFNITCILLYNKS
jgi:hypothetical protein